MGKNPKQIIEEDVELLKRKVDELKRQAGPKIDQGKQFVAKEEKEVEAYIRANPLKSVALAFTLGLLLGKLSK
ncbi:MAG: hypothetical protein WC501_02265 [Candidatus Micrarchaeia archaeon]